MTNTYNKLYNENNSKNMTLTLQTRKFVQRMLELAYILVVMKLEDQYYPKTIPYFQLGYNRQISRMTTNGSRY